MIRPKEHVDSTKLTEEEKAIIAAKRLGAGIEVYFHRCETYEEAVKKANLLGTISRIQDLDHTVGFSTDSKKKTKFTSFLDK